jgi:hypothetical protein
VLLWYVGLSVVLVHAVFRSTGIDYRLIAAGALLPVAVDLPLGRRAYGHTLVFGVALFVVTVLATVGRSRLLRRRLVCVPIGALCGLVLSGAWAGGPAFWWPFTGTTLPDEPLLPPLVLVALEELVGLGACVWATVRFGLADPGRRRALLHDGRLREVAPP